MVNIGDKIKLSFIDAGYYVITDILIDKYVMCYCSFDGTAIIHGAEVTPDFFDSNNREWSYYTLDFNEVM